MKKLKLQSHYKPPNTIKKINKKKSKKKIKHYSITTSYIFIYNIYLYIFLY